MHLHPTRFAIYATDDLPPVSGVYFVMAGRSIVYVGSARNIYARWLDHHVVQRLVRYFRGHFLKLDIRVVECTEYRSVERWVIDHYSPCMNRRGLSREHCEYYSNTTIDS